MDGREDLCGCLAPSFRTIKVSIKADDHSVRVLRSHVLVSVVEIQVKAVHDLDELGPDVKKTIHNEAKRLIELYNALLKEFKESLTGKK